MVYTFDGILSSKIKRDEVLYMTQVATWMDFETAFLVREASHKGPDVT